MGGNAEMVSFNFDPTEGPHIASGLSDQELDFLQQVLAIELAIRMDDASYQMRFHKIAEHRVEMDEIVSDWRRQRDRMKFVESVTSDLDQLMVLEER
ncbi:MAG TPA: hypothetical protein VFZ80_02305 [Acidimicrobiia bacterium]